MSVCLLEFSSILCFSRASVARACVCVCNLMLLYINTCYIWLTSIKRGESANGALNLI